MPRVAPLMPRKMLPPPTTIAISTPNSMRASVASDAMRCTTAESMPYPVVRSANASPESFRTTRRYRLSGIRAPFRRGQDFGCVRPLAREALLPADLDAREPAHLRIGTKRSDERRDRLLVVLHERLVEQRAALPFEEA